MFISASTIDTDGCGETFINVDALSLILVELEATLTLADMIVDQVSALAVVAFAIVITFVGFIAMGTTAVDFESYVANTSKAADSVEAVSVWTAVKCRIETFISVNTVDITVP